MPDSEGDYLHYWYQALSTPFGLELICSEPELTKSRLYAARREAKDVDLEAVSICQSPFDRSRLWLIKRTKENAAP